jgi:hypothetical protein
MFDEYFAERISVEIQKDLLFPVPSPMLTYIVQQAVSSLSTDLSINSKEQLQEILEAAATPTENDDLTEQDIHRLADAIAKDINPKINVPVLDEEQEYVLLQQIMRVILPALTQTGGGGGVSLPSAEANLQLSRNLLGGPQARQKLVRALDKQVEENMAIFSSLVNDKQRLDLISQAVDACAVFLYKLLPPDLCKTLRDESPQGLLEMKEYLIDTVNKKVDLMGFDETQEREFIATMVNLLIDEYIQDDTTASLFLSPAEQEDRLKEKRAALQREKVLSQRRYAREQARLEEQLTQLDNRLRELRRKHSLWRRTWRRIRTKQ